MTNAEIMTQVLSEVTGRPKAELAAIVEATKQYAPGAPNWTKNCRQKSQSVCLNALRQEKVGILNWILRGGVTCQFVSTENTGPLQGLFPCNEVMNKVNSL